MRPYDIRVYMRLGKKIKDLTFGRPRAMASAEEDHAHGAATTHCKILEMMILWSSTTFSSRPARLSKEAELSD